MPCWMLTSTRCSVPPPSLAAPQRSPVVLVPQPADQPLALYAVPAVGKVVLTDGAVRSVVNVTEVAALSLPTASVAYTIRV